MKLGWRGAIGILISAALLIYVFSQINWGQARDTLRHANYWLLLLTSITATAIFPLRARRWRTILDPVAPRLPMGKLWRATAIGMMATNVLTRAAGEPARAIALAREAPEVPFSTGFASIAVDRVFDALAILLLMAVALLSPSFPAGTTIGGKPIGIYTTGFVGLIVIGFAGLYALVFFPQTLIRAFEAIARRVAPRIEARGRDTLAAFAQGLSVLKSPVHFFAVFFWTVLHWLVNALSFWIGFKAVGIDAPFAAALFTQGVIAVGVSVPSSPGFFGIFEVFARAGLNPYGIGVTPASIWAIAFHLVSFIPITIIGAVYFVRLGVHVSDLESIDRETSQ